MEKFLKCKICGSELIENRLSRHIRMKHQMSIEEYNALPSEDGAPPVVESIEEVEQPLATNPVEQIENIFAGVEDKFDIEINTVKDLLDKFGITFEELKSIILNFTKGVAIPATVSQEREVTSAKKEAERLNGDSEIKVTKVTVAEILVRDFGYTCVSVSGGKLTGTTKIWLLRKSK